MKPTLALTNQELHGVQRGDSDEATAPCASEGRRGRACVVQDV